MNETTHVRNLISDYVLDLLPRNERRQVEVHAAVCAPCRRALHRERALGRGVRDALAAVTRPPAGQPPPNLARFMPPLRPRRRFWPAVLDYQRPLATLGVLLLILLGSFSLRPTGSGADWSLPSATALSATATATTAPTLTVTGTAGGDALTPDRTPAVLTPFPAATPIAAIGLNYQPLTNH